MKPSCHLTLTRQCPLPMHQGTTTTESDLPAKQKTVHGHLFHIYSLMCIAIRKKTRSASRISTKTPPHCFKPIIYVTTAAVLPVYFPHPYCVHIKSNPWTHHHEDPPPVGRLIVKLRRILSPHAELSRTSSTFSAALPRLLFSPEPVPAPPSSPLSKLNAELVALW